jgi:hypothetical protein
VACQYVDTSTPTLLVPMGTFYPTSSDPDSVEAFLRVRSGVLLVLPPPRFGASSAVFRRDSASAVAFSVEDRWERPIVRASVTPSVTLHVCAGEFEYGR